MKTQIRRKHIYLNTNKTKPSQQDNKTLKLAKKEGRTWVLEGWRWAAILAIRRKASVLGSMMLEDKRDRKNEEERGRRARREKRGDFYTKIKGYGLFLIGEDVDTKGGKEKNSKNCADWEAWDE